MSLATCQSGAGVGAGMRREQWGVVEGVPSEGSMPGFDVPAAPACVTSGKSDLTSLSLSFHICRMEMVNLSAPNFTGLLLLINGDDDDDADDGDAKGDKRLPYTKDSCFRHHTKHLTYSISMNRHDNLVRCLIVTSILQMRKPNLRQATSLPQGHSSYSVEPGFEPGVAGFTA